MFSGFHHEVAEAYVLQDVTRGMFVIYRRFGIAYRSHFQGLTFKNRASYI